MSDELMTQKAKKLQNFIQQYIEWLEHSANIGSAPQLPKFQLYAYDYLEFAEEELLKYQTESNAHKQVALLINCIAHLKRAIDCQLDTFLYVFNLYSTFSNRNLKFQKKLEFLNEVGIFSPRSLERLNSVRNKMEHQFEAPQLQDIEVYFDLTSAFVAVLQSSIMFSLNSYLEMIIVDPDNPESEIGTFSMEYKYEQPSIVVSWEIDKNTESLVLS